MVSFTASSENLRKALCMHDVHARLHFVIGSLLKPVAEAHLISACAPLCWRHLWEGCWTSACLLDDLALMRSGYDFFMMPQHQHQSSCRGNLLGVAA